MPRKLPWLVQSRQNAPGTSTASFSPAPPAKKRKPAPLTDNAVLNDDLNHIAPSTPPTRRLRQRTLSTSPPPAPPNVEPMREGWRHDDAWMMVEDELVSTARLFTTHIHHAEYVRLKRLARSRGDGALTRIARPVDGGKERSAEVKSRELAAEQEKRVREKVGEGEEDGEVAEEEEPWRYDAKLAELMVGRERERRDLSGLVRGERGAGSRRSSTRLERGSGVVGAESGLRRSSGILVETETEDDDDLDAPVLKSRQPSVRPQSSRQTSLHEPSREVSREKEDTRPRTTKESIPSVRRSAAQTSNVPKPRPFASTGARQTINQPVVKPEPSPAVKKGSTGNPVTLDFDDMTARSQGGTQASAFLAKRKAAREKKQREREETEQKSKVKTEPDRSIDEVPFWMS